MFTIENYTGISVPQYYPVYICKDGDIKTVTLMYKSDIKATNLDFILPIFSYEANSLQLKYIQCMIMQDVKYTMIIPLGE